VHYGKIICPLCVFAVVAFINTQLSDESTTSTSVDRLVQCERRIVSQFRRFRAAAAAPLSTDLAHAISTELLQLGLGIEIIELRERDSVCFPPHLKHMLKNFRRLFVVVASWDKDKLV